MKSLANLLQRKKDQSPTWKGVEASLIVEEATKILVDILGVQVIQYAQPAYYKNLTLTFACLSSTVAQELKLNEKQIIERINDKFGKNTVKKVSYLA